MDIHTAVGEHLINTTEIYEKVGERVYWPKLPDETDYPAISYFRVSNPGHSLAQKYTPRFQFDVWSKKAGEALEIAELIKKAFQGFKGIMGGSNGKPIKQGIYYDMYELYEKDTGVYHMPVDVFFVYLED